MPSIDASIIKAFGQIAGIGGLSLLVFAWLFREVIRKRIFPQLSREHAYKIIRLFMLLVFLLSLSGISAWVYIEHSRASRTSGHIPKEDVSSSISHWLALIDDARYREAWQSMPKPFKDRLSENAFIELFTSQRGPKGEVTSRVPYSSNTISSPLGYPSGEYEARAFITHFQDGTQVVETVIAMGTEDGWKVASHTISPPIQ